MRTARPSFLRRVAGPVLVAPLAGCLWGAAYELPAIPEPAPVGDPVPTVHSTRRSDGSLARQWSVLIHADGLVVRDGPDRAWYADGQAEYVREYSLDQTTGTWRSWYADGTLRSDYSHREGGAATPMVFYHPCGAVSARGPASRGVREGEWCFYYPLGTLRQRGRYAGGLKQGVWDLRHGNGGLASRGRILDDVRVGEWRHWPVEPAVIEDDWCPQQVARESGAARGQ